MMHAGCCWDLKEREIQSTQLILSLFQLTESHARLSLPLLEFSSYVDLISGLL